MNRITTISFLLITVFLIGCNGPKSLTKKGNKLSEAGLHSDAITYYMKALTKKKTHIDALIGLKNSSRAILNDYNSKFFTAYNSADNKTAVYTYLEMDKFVKKVNVFNAGLTITKQYTEDFTDAKKSYLDARFEEANEFISKENFNAANIIFEEIEDIEPDYEGQDFDALKEIALLEPRYRNGVNSYNKDQFRNAYFEFNFICDRNPNYKDSKFKRDDALENAQFSIGVMKFKNLSRDPSVSEFISSEMINEILRSNNPFIQLIDRSNMDNLVTEQMITMNGLTNGSNTQSGELIGANAFLNGVVLKVSKRHQRPTSQKVKAYRSEKVKKYDAANDKTYYETKYKKTQYLKYSGFNEVVISFQFKLISAETGRILLSETVEEKIQDKVEYATYSGNYKQLVPGHWKNISTASAEDKVSSNRSEKSNLKSLFTARQKLNSSSSMQQSIQNKIAKSVARKIINFNPEQ